MHKCTKARLGGNRDELELEMMKMKNLHKTVRPSAKSTRPIATLAEQSKPRWRARRNALVAAVNAGLEQGVFGLGADENAFPLGESMSYRFEIAGIPGAANARDIGWSELRIQVALWPAEESELHLDCACNTRAMKTQGKLLAYGWLERMRGKYIMDGSAMSMYCSSYFLDEAANIKVEPNGYADIGPFIF
jgi:hypothetical protein